ncbi:MAG: hypothetical protein MJE77_09160 [Proteobacteria bacterium]|nr:hypothetical protein [Pseudomonadota bacterium]
MESSQSQPRRFMAKRRRRAKPDAEIVLICNPRAGGRWKELAGILDSEEARFARRIVTDSVEDIAAALDDLGHDAKLLCIYGGDGTIQRVLDRLAPGAPDEVHLALLGGGTMNVTSRWCGLSRQPVKNFRYLVRAYRSGNLLLKEVPVLEVTMGDLFHRGFTFGMGPIVRLLDVYERGPKGKVAAAGLAARALSATLLKWPGDLERIIQPMEADVEIDGEALSYRQFVALFANVTGQINPGVEPFAGERTRDSFHTAAYAVNAREMAMALPLLIRGWLPVDANALLSPATLLARRKNGPDRRTLPSDPRYVNQIAHHLQIHTDEPLYTLDGEVLPTRSKTISVELGPSLKLAVGPTATS